MDMNLLYAILIALVPVVITAIMSKVYNIVHGIITFIVTGHLLVFCLSIFGANLPADITANMPTVCGLYVSIDSIVVSALGLLGLGDLLAGTFGVYIVLAVFVVLFIVSQIIASVLRKKRVEKINSLKRQVKRY